MAKNYADKANSLQMALRSHLGSSEPVVVYRKRNNKAKIPNGYYAHCDGCVFGACPGGHYLGKDVNNMLQVLLTDSRSIICPGCRSVTKGRWCVSCGIHPIPEHPQFVGSKVTGKSLVDCEPYKLCYLARGG